MDMRIRRGGMETPEGFRFELSGGDVALDFVNTLDSRPTEHPRELVPSYAELASWGRQAGILSRGRERDLLQESRRHPKEAESARKLAVSLRECMFGVFSHVIDGRQVPRDTLAEWNRFVLQSTKHHELIQSKEGFSWRLLSDTLELDSVLWPVVHSAVALLTGPNLSRIRRCAAAKCDWLFLDMSKRGNRRWCDMTVCGNRAKAQRFYSRKKARKESQEGAD